MANIDVRTTLDRQNRNELDSMLKELYSVLTSLVIDGGMTPEQYAEYTQILNGLIKKGDLSVSDINKNLGKLDQTYMTDEFLEQIAGNAEINATPADGSITLVKLDSVLRDHINNFNDTLTNQNESWEI